jgi:hypothetical protein
VVVKKSKAPVKTTIESNHTHTHPHRVREEQW